MRKLVIYFLITILVFSQNPSLINAGIIEDIDTEKDVVLFAEEIGEDIKAYSSIESIETDNSELSIPDEAESIWLTEQKVVEHDGIEYALLHYVDEDDRQEEVIEVYVDNTTIVLVDEVDDFKLDRLTQVEENEEESIDELEEKSVESDSIENKTDDAIEQEDKSNTEATSDEQTANDETPTPTDEIESEENDAELDEQVEQEMVSTIQLYRTMPTTRSLVLVLENGMRHANVKTLKANLKKLGFTVPGKGTTLFGKQTEKKVQEFQRYYGLSADGKAGTATLAKVDSILNSPLQRGKRHNNTKTLKADLKAIGYTVPGKGTTLYGKDTERIIKKFQKDKKLIVNGIADERTLAKIVELKKQTNTPSNPSVLENGMRHANVKTLKTNLKKLGFTVPGKGTTLFGKATEQKVREFQRYYGLSADGKAGSATFNKINNILNSPLQKGKRHKDTKKLKSDLKSIGYTVPGKGTTLYGKNTEKVVEKFQKDKKLVVNGIADERTLAKIAELNKQSNKPSNPSVLENGMRHANVKTLKANLKKLGFTVPGKGTNLYGKATERKVRDFQRYYGLSADGKAGNATFNKINSVLNSPLQKGKRHSSTKKLKTDLKSIGYPVPGKGTNLYGTQTEKIIRQFQKDYKLAVNGIADDVTLAKIANLATNQKTVKIFIDAGHGGSDPGTVSNGVQEKVMTLDISKRVERYLNQYRGVTTKMSRTNDKTLTLAERTKAANNWKADFFFSVHINSGGGNGIESFVYNNKPTQDEINKQKIIHDHITSKVNDRDRGKKRANFHVLRETNMTAMLFEYLFIDTYNDRIKLTNANYRDKLAKATADGIAKAHGLKK